MMNLVVMIFGLQMVYCLLPICGQYVAIVALEPLIDLKADKFNAQVVNLASYICPCPLI